MTGRRGGGGAAVAEDDVLDAVVVRTGLEDRTAVLVAAGEFPAGSREVAGRVVAGFAGRVDGPHAPATPIVTSTATAVTTRGAAERVLLISVPRERGRRGTGQARITRSRYRVRQLRRRQTGESRHDSRVLAGDAAVTAVQRLRHRVEL